MIIGLSQIGINCFDIGKVIGYNRVPLPRARMISFMRAIPAEKSFNASPPVAGDPSRRPATCASPAA
ncbi:hypothetical protein [Sphingobium yanoikuyae]|uniref:hypothetical protein n=1 Tax=Sphingobium yanoikuyae TaxID=13690 RepID=UPI002FDDB130